MNLQIFTLKVTKNLGISSNVKNETGYGNTRLGIQFPVKEFSTHDNFRIVVNFFLENDSYAIGKPLILAEKPISVIYRKAYDIAIGIQF